MRSRPNHSGVASKKALLSLQNRAMALLHHPSDTAVLIVLAMSMLPFLWSLETSADEFLWLSAADRVRAGEMIYRDFFEFVTPAATYFMAGVLAIFGHSLVAARAVQLFTVLIGLWLSLRFCRNFDICRTEKWFFAGAFVLICYRSLPFVSHHWLALPWVSLTLLLLIRAAETGENLAWLGTGLAISITGLFLQSDGVMLGALCLATMTTVTMLKRYTWRASLAAFMFFVGGCAVPLMLMALHLWRNGALGAAIDDVWFWTLNHYRIPGGINDVAYGTDLRLYLEIMARDFTVPRAIAAIASGAILYLAVPGTMLGCSAWLGGQVIQRLCNRATFNPSDVKWVALNWWVLGFGLLAMKGRADLSHIAIYSWPVWLLWVCMVSVWKKHYANLANAALRWFPATLMSVLFIYPIMQVTTPWRTSGEIWWQQATPDEYFRRDPVIRYIRSHVPPGERIVAFPFGGYFHFWSQRLCAVKIDYMLPPSSRYNSEAEYRAFWDDVRRQRPALIVFLSDPETVAYNYDRTSWQSFVPKGYQHTRDLPSRMGRMHIYERSP